MAVSNLPVTWLTSDTVSINLWHNHSTSTWSIPGTVSDPGHSHGFNVNTGIGGSPFSVYGWGSNSFAASPGGFAISGAVTNISVSVPAQNYVTSTTAPSNSHAHSIPLNNTGWQTWFPIINPYLSMNTFMYLGY